MRSETSAVFNELLDEMCSLEGHLLDHPNALDDEQYRCEAYRWIFSITQVAMDCFVWGDSAMPRFVDIVGPTKKWGGDNSDAFYQYAPIDPSRRYRVSGVRGDAVYLSLSVYGGPDDGRYSERIVGWVNDHELTFDDDGNFEFWVGPQPEDGPGILLAPDAVAAITRDYLAEPTVGRRTTWRIEAVDPPDTVRQTDADLARRMRAALTWVRDQAAIVPLGLGEPNIVDDPYPVPQQTFGWAAGDASYAMGSFSLADDETLIMRGRSPQCAFWSVCLWNPLLHTYDWAYDRVTVNGEQVRYEPDGSWEIHIGLSDSGHPNFVSTQGHPAGRIWFRWFLPDHTPEAIATEVRRLPPG